MRKVEYIYFQDRLVPSDELRVDVQDRGLLLGDGIFETMLSHFGSIPHLKMHWQRLNTGLSVLDIPNFLSFEQLESAVQKLLKANELENAEAALRLTITRGGGPRGLLPPKNPSPRFILTAFPYQAPQKEAFSAIIASTRRNEYSPLSKIKSLCYLDNVLARQEAFKNGVDEALLLNSKGKIVGASAANVFFLKKGRLFTADVDEGVLPGITRKCIVEAAHERLLPVEFKAIDVKDLPLVEEAFVTNALQGVMPLIEINGMRVGNGEVGEVTALLKTQQQSGSKGFEGCAW